MSSQKSGKIDKSSIFTLPADTKTGDDGSSPAEIGNYLDSL